MNAECRSAAALCFLFRISPRSPVFPLRKPEEIKIPEVLTHV